MSYKLYGFSFTDSSPLLCGFRNMLQHITYWFQVGNQRMFSFTSNKKATVACVSKFFSECLDHWLALSPKKTSGFICSAYFMLHIKAPWCSEHSRGTQCYSNNVCHPSSFHLTSSYANSWTADSALFIKWNSMWNSEFSFVYMLTLAHNWLLKDFCPTVTLMICWLWWRENPVLDDQPWCYASQYYALDKK